MLNEKKVRLQFCFLILIAIISVGIVFSMGPIPQNINYHAFADTRDRFGMVNANDVLSNVVFMIAGGIGLIRLRRWSSNETNLWCFFFFSTILVGSTYYHLQPSNATLVWDRLPMTLCFAALTSCIFTERLGSRIGRILFTILATSGIVSVLYWWATERAGVGDLRPYIVVQYLPMLLIPIVLMLFPRSWSQSKYYWLLFSSYIVAKLFELNDDAIFQLTHQMISGHTLKHLAAGFGIVFFRPAALTDAEIHSDRNRRIS